jgi:hypothetical protein
VPPWAERRLVTAAMNGTEVFNVRMAPTPTLPISPPPTAYCRIRTVAPLAGTAPYRRRAPSGSRTAGPNSTSPAAPSSTKCRSSGPLSAKCSTGVHSCQPSSEPTSTTGSPTPVSTGRDSSGKTCADTPSESPSTSSATSSALTASPVAPIVAQERPCTTGDAV